MLQQKTRFKSFDFLKTYKPLTGFKQYPTPSNVHFFEK